MNKYIGPKIKKLAFFLCIGGMLVSFLFGMLHIGSVNEAPVAIRDQIRFDGWLMIIGGGIASWLVALLAYGFGELLVDLRKNRQVKEAPARRILPSD